MVRLMVQGLLLLEMFKGKASPREAPSRASMPSTKRVSLAGSNELKNAMIKVTTRSPQPPPMVSPTNKYKNLTYSPLSLSL